MGSRRPCGGTGAGVRIIVRMPRTVIWLLTVPVMIAGFSSRPYARTPQPDDHGRISIVDYGAVPDGRTDSTTAIRVAVRAAKMQGRSVFGLPGTFIYGRFGLDSVSMSGDGAISILIAPDPPNSHIYLRGSGSSLRNLTPKVRSSGHDHSNFAIYVDRTRDFLIEAVELTGGNAGGIYNSGGSDGRIIHNQIQSTLADAIHDTDGAHGIIIADNIVRHAGDDMIAVVSYSNERVVHNVLIQNNDLMDSTSSRGISVVGGQGITIQGNMVVRTDCCVGIWLASEAF
jgi:Pectate lyase superfamily protein